MTAATAEALTDLAAAGKIPADAGKMDFYSWDVVATYSIGQWANITHKK